MNPLPCFHHGPTPDVAVTPEPSLTELRFTPSRLTLEGFFQTRGGGGLGRWEGREGCAEPAGAADADAPGWGSAAEVPSSQL